MMLHKNNSKYSQSGQDAFVISYFKNKRDGVFVDIGANDGVSLSNTYYLEKELGWTGICFEPISSIFEKLDKDRNCIKINAGVAETNTSFPFTFVDGPSNMLSGLTEYHDPRHRARIEKEVRELGGRIVEMEIPCVVFNEVVAEHEFFDIDYLSIDTEGNEFTILKSIDFDKFNIKAITIENNFNDPVQTNYLVSKGYQLVGKLEADDVFIKLKKRT